MQNKTKKTFFSGLTVAAFLLNSVTGAAATATQTNNKAGGDLSQISQTDAATVRLANGPQDCCKKDNN